MIGNEIFGHEEAIRIQTTPTEFRDYTSDGAATPAVGYPDDSMAHPYDYGATQRLYGATGGLVETNGAANSFMDRLIRE